MVADTRHLLQARSTSLMKPYVFWLLAIASSQALPVESGTKITPRRLASKVEPKQQALPRLLWPVLQQALSRLQQLA